jgi:hypothetical protein
MEHGCVSVSSVKFMKRPTPLISTPFAEAELTSILLRRMFYGTTISRPTMPLELSAGDEA